MNFALLIRSKATSALCDWAVELLSAHRPAPLALRSLVAEGICIGAKVPATVNDSRSRAHPTIRPLRVVRVIESGQASTSDVGRMVISGRMADVCAELDRMEAREAAEIGLLGRSMTAAC